MSRRGGAATTEKLFVLVFASVLIGGAIMLFGPTLVKKYSFAASLLGADPAPMATLADGRVERSGTDPLWYVLYTAIFVVFFMTLIAPLLFPRARQTRQELIVGLADRFPFLEPLIDRDALVEKGMEELRGLAAEVHALEKHKSKALDIQPHDFGKMALPSEQTVDASFSEMPDLEAILAQADPSRARSGAQKSTARRQPGFEIDQSEDTQMAIPLSQRLNAIRGDDEIPFDAIDPSLKPQLQGLKKPPVKNASRPFAIPSDDSATVDVGSSSDVYDRPDALAARILRESGALQAIQGDVDATLVHNSQPLPSMVSSEAETGHMDSLPERLSKSGPLDTTTPDNVRRSDALDATTQDYAGYDPD